MKLVAQVKSKQSEGIRVHHPPTPTSSYPIREEGVLQGVHHKIHILILYCLSYCWPSQWTLPPLLILLIVKVLVSLLNLSTQNSFIKTKISYQFPP